MEVASRDTAPGTESKFAVPLCLYCQIPYDITVIPAEEKSNKANPGDFRSIPISLKNKFKMFFWLLVLFPDRDGVLWSQT